MLSYSLCHLLVEETVFADFAYFELEHGVSMQSEPEFVAPKLLFGRSSIVLKSVVCNFFNSVSRV